MATGFLERGMTIEKAIQLYRAKAERLRNRAKTLDEMAKKLEADLLADTKTTNNGKSSAKPTIDSVGAVPFIPFKSNSVGMGSRSPHWKRMWAHFTLRSEDFLNHYHRRSNVETAMWMVKSKFGGSVRSKLPTAQANEVLAKVLCHNLTCIVHAITEFGIEVDFNKPTAPTAPTLTLVKP